MSLGQDFASRGARMDEALDIYRAAWETDPVTHDGAHYDFADMKLQPKPEGRIPIWVGGLADVAIRRAARHEGYQGISTSPDDMKALVGRLSPETLDYMQVKGSVVVLDGNDEREGRPPGHPCFMAADQLEWPRRDLAATAAPQSVSRCIRRAPRPSGSKPASPIRPATRIWPSRRC